VALLHDRGATFGTVRVNIDENNTDADKPDDEGWFTLVTPVAEMRSTPDVSGPVRRVILSGDKEDSFFLAELALVVETGKISVSIRQPTDAPDAQIAEVTVKPGPITLVADVESGVSDPIIEWNFDADTVGNLPPPVGMVVPGAVDAEGNPITVALRACAQTYRECRLCPV
jgi:hypothetical protein